MATRKDPSTDPKSPEYKGPPQKAAPHRCPDGTINCLTDEQLNENLRVYVENHLAWPKKPTGGFQGMYNDQDSNSHVFEMCGYGKAGIQAQITKRWHAAHGGKGIDPNNVNERIKALGIDMSGDKNPNVWAG
jgi:hypothetical protein